MAVRAIPFVTPDEYLQRERAAETKSEYEDGYVVAVAGASKKHNAITFDLARFVGNALDGGPCDAYSSDMRVRIHAGNRYYYPGVIVYCGEPHFEDEELDTLLNPVVVFEVLSDST